MKIEIQFVAQLRDASAVPLMNIEMSDGATVSDALKMAAAEGGADLQAKLLSSESELQPGILVFVNDSPVAAKAIRTHALTDGDNILLLPPISGG